MPLLLAMTVVSGQPTSPSDDVAIRRKDALKVLAAADSGRIYMIQSAQLKKDVDTLNKRIEILQEISSNLKSVIIMKDSVISTHLKEQVIMMQQRAILESAAQSLNKQIKRSRRTTKLVAILGILAAGGAFWLGSK